MSKKIIQVKFYQGVRLVADTLTSFTPDELLSDAVLRKGRYAEIVDNGVLLCAPEMSVLVPWNNIAYVQYTETKSADIKKIK